MKLTKFSGAFTRDTTLYLWIIAVLVVVIAFFDYWLGLAGVLVLVYLAVHNMRTSTRKKEELRLYIENLSDSVDIATKNTILNLPFPLVIVDEQGVINWYNMLFSNIFQGEYILDKRLSSYVSGVDLGRVLKNETEEFKYVNIKDRYYDIHCNLITLKESSEERNIIIMYLVDKTDYVSIRSKYSEERPVIATLQIDNYEEVLKDVEELAKPAIIAEVDRRIKAWASLSNASIQKYSNGEYILHFMHKQLMEMEEKRFDILDSMREINSGNRIPITISIGVGVNGKTLTELQDFSHSAMDIALGRGGDQAVVKDNDKLSFYGGKTKAVEKRTRVKARVMAYALRQLIEQSENVIILGHEMPDLDCLGSALGIYRCCTNLNKDVKIVLNKVNAAIANLWNELEEDEEIGRAHV